MICGVALPADVGLYAIDLMGVMMSIIMVLMMLMMWVMSSQIYSSVNSCMTTYDARNAKNS